MAGLWALSPEGGVPVPLEHVDVICSVCQECASVTLQHRFTNHEEMPIEAVYALPVSQDAVVCLFSADIGGKLIVGVAKQKEIAKQEYKEAIEKGDGAYLLEKKSDEMFEMQIGNIPPKNTVHISVTFVTQLRTDENGKILFVLPVSVLPTPQKPQEGQKQEQKVQELDYSVNVEVQLGMSERIISVSSPSHSDVEMSNFAAEGSNEGVVRRKFSSHLTTDFELLIHIHNPNAPIVSTEYNEATSSHAVYITFLPDLNSQLMINESGEGVPVPQPKTEVIILVDCSDSIFGRPLKYAQLILQKLLNLLYINCSESGVFNVIRFGGEIIQLFENSQLATLENIRTAKNFPIDASLGTTNLLEALESVYSSESPVGFNREIFIITDGKIVDPQKTIQIVRKNSPKNRCFVFGIGDEDYRQDSFGFNVSVPEAFDGKEAPTRADTGPASRDEVNLFGAMGANADVDVCFMVDCTGSMGAFIQATKAYIAGFVKIVRAKFPGIKLRVSFLGYRDHCDVSWPGNFHIRDFTESEHEFLDFVQNIQATGGGDAPEDVNGALQKSLDLDWQSPVRVLFHITDAPPHGREYHNFPDDFPNRHKNDEPIDKLLNKLKMKDITYFFGKIHTLTDTMIRIFERTIDVQVVDISDPKFVLAAISGFTQFSIDSALAHSVVRGIARAGRGECEFIKNTSELPYKVSRHFEKCLQPSISQLEFDWNGLSVAQYPYRLRPIFHGEPYRVFGLIENSSNEQEGKTDSDREKLVQQLSVEPDGEADAEESDAGPDVGPDAGPDTEEPDAELDAEPDAEEPDAEPDGSEVKEISGEERKESDNKRATVYLRGRLPDGSIINFPFEVDLTSCSTGRVIHSLAAREAMRDLEESESKFHDLLESGEKIDIFSSVKEETIRLGVKYNLASTYTSFIAVEKRESEGELRAQNVHPVKRYMKGAEPSGPAHETVPSLPEPSRSKSSSSDGCVRYDRRRRAGVTVPIAVTSSISWRMDGIKYRTNRITLNVTETVDALVHSSGEVLRREVNGVIRALAHLSGFPECKLGFNEVLSQMCFDSDYLSFHQCVRLGLFDNYGRISFIPPDGEFQLAAYRIGNISRESATLPIQVIPVINQLSPNLVQYFIMVKSNYRESIAPSSLTVTIPCHPNVAKLTFRLTRGSFRHDSSTNSIIWKIPNCLGKTTQTLQGEADILPSTGDAVPWAKAPILLHFTIPKFSVTGLKILYLKIFEKAGYEAEKRVDYVTKCDTFEVRTQY